MKHELQEISLQLAELTERLNALIAKMEASDIADEATIETTPEPSEGEEPAETQQGAECTKAQEPTVAAQPVKPIQFTLNDRYRFLREIFGNSMSEMTDAVSSIEQMSNPEEVTTYVINTLNLDPEQEIVKDFLAAVNERFNERPTLLA